MCFPSVLILLQWDLQIDCPNVALFHTLIHYSTVDQFSGESNPVILPLDEDEVSFFLSTFMEFKEFNVFTIPLRLVTYSWYSFLTWI